MASNQRKPSPRFPWKFLGLSTLAISITLAFNIHIGDVFINSSGDSSANEPPIEYNTSTTKKLKRYVAQENYKEAHLLTVQLLLAAVGKESGFIKSSDLEDLGACKSMIEVDRAWNEGSSGKYSFSTQQEIYKVSQARGPEWNKYQDFMINVGWADPEKGMLPPNLTSTAPKGHMPYWDDTFKESGDGDFHWFRIFEQCQKKPLL